MYVNAWIIVGISANERAAAAAATAIFLNFDRYVREMLKAMVML